MTEEEYWTLRDAYFDSEGIRHYNAFLSNQLSWRTFDHNYRELASLISLHFRLQVERKLGDWKNKKPLHDMIMDVTRLLHNYLASAKTLIDHTRCFVVRTYGQGSAPWAEYQAEIDKRFKGIPVVDFTKELRNHFTHVGMPFISSVMGGSRATGRDLFTLQLDTKKMAEVGTWNSGARTYLSSCAGRVDLELYSDEYYRAIWDFYNWLGPRVELWSSAFTAVSDEMLRKLVEHEKRTSP